MFPIHLNLGFRELFFYEGFYFLAAMITGFAAGRRLAVKKAGITKEQFESLIVGCLISAVLGIRLSHFIFWDPESLLRNPLKFFYFWEGGASVVGGLIFGILFGWFYCIKKGLAFWKIFAAISPGLLLGQAVGRIGCFLNGDAHGVASNLPWAVRFARYGTEIPSFKIKTGISSAPWIWSFNNNLVDASTKRSAPLHPTQLYESLGDLVLMGLVLFVFKILSKKKLNMAPVLFIHTGGYALMRAMLQFIRTDRSRIIFLGMSYLQIILLAWALFSLVMISILLIVKREEKISAE